MFTHYVCFICDHFSCYNLDDAVILTCILVANKEICLYSGDDEKVARLLVDEAAKYDIEIKVYKVEIK